jgi:hypothetical protein
VFHVPVPPEQSVISRSAACGGHRASQSMSMAVIIGWIIELVGMALWLYGYFATDHPSLVYWHAYTPWWIADYLPNIESEIGMVLVFAGMVPLYWPPRR